MLPSVREHSSSSKVIPFFFLFKKENGAWGYWVTGSLVNLWLSFPCKRDLVSINVALVLAIGRQQSACIDAYMHLSF